MNRDSLFFILHHHLVPLAPLVLLVYLLPVLSLPILPSVVTRFIDENDPTLLHAWDFASQKQQYPPMKDMVTGMEIYDYSPGVMLDANKRRLRFNNETIIDNSFLYLPMEYAQSMDNMRGHEVTWLFYYEIGWSAYQGKDPSILSMGFNIHEYIQLSIYSSFTNIKGLSFDAVSGTDEPGHIGIVTSAVGPDQIQGRVGNCAAFRLNPTTNRADIVFSHANRLVVGETQTEMGDPLERIGQMAENGGQPPYWVLGTSFKEVNFPLQMDIAKFYTYGKFLDADQINILCDKFRADLFPDGLPTAESNDTIIPLPDPPILSPTPCPTPGSPPPPPTVPPPHPTVPPPHPYSIPEPSSITTLEPSPITTPGPTPITSPVPTPITSPVPTPISTPNPCPVASPIPSPIATPIASPVATPFESSSPTADNGCDKEEIYDGGPGFWPHKDDHPVFHNTSEICRSASPSHYPILEGGCSVEYIKELYCPCHGFDTHNKYAQCVFRTLNYYWKTGSLSRCDYSAIMKQVRTDQCSLGIRGKKSMNNRGK